MFHLCGWGEDLDPAAGYVGVTALIDQTGRVEGDVLYVPRGKGNLIGAAALISTTSEVGARIESPSLRTLSNLQIEPFAQGLVFANPQDILMHPMSPTPLVEDEGLILFVNTDPGVAEFHYGLIWLSDGPQPPINGVIHTLLATAAITLDEAAWVYGELTWATTLPVGRYQIVGMRVRSANIVAARLVFPESNWRPGVPGVVGASNIDNPYFRFGRIGVFGEFDSQTPPGIEILGVTDTSETVLLDVIKIS